MMSITFNKINESEGTIKTDKYILTPTHGKIPIKDTVDLSTYIYFDTVDGYDLFINSETDEPIAIPEGEDKKLNEDTEPDNVNDDKDSNEENNINDDMINIENEIKLINDKYKVNKVEFANSDRSIIIQGDNDILSQIYSDYEANSTYKPILVTDSILFLELIDDTIQLESTGNDVVDKLDDQTLKNVLTKSGIKLTGSENKDTLKGMVKGALGASTK